MMPVKQLHRFYQDSGEFTRVEKIAFFIALALTALVLISYIGQHVELRAAGIL